MSKKLSFLVTALLLSSLIAEQARSDSKKEGGQNEAASKEPGASEPLAAESKKEETKTELPKQASAASSESAQAPTLQINGFTAMIAAASKQKDNSNGKGGGAHVALGASNIFFTVKGNSAEGFRYKYRVAMESYPGGKSTSNNAIYFTQNYIEFSQDSWGIFQTGNVVGVEDTMVESGFNLLQGAGSIDGTFGNIINSAEGVIGGVQQHGGTSKAMKVVYYTPTIHGVTLGLAWTPNTTRMGTGGKDNSGASPDNTYGNDSGIYPDKSIAAYGMNNLALGANYKVDFKTWNMALAAVFIQERSKRGSPKWVEGQSGAYNDSTLEFFKYSKVHRGKSMQYTAAIGFDQWRFATGFIHNGKTRVPKTSNYRSGDAGKAWNIAGQYTVGAYQFALGYFNTTRMLPQLPSSSTATYKYGATGGKAKSHIVSATIDFNALQGLKFFGEVDVFKMNTDSNYSTFVGNTTNYKSGSTVPTPKNSGAAVVVGTKLSF